jgi:hypothetical protein
MRRLLAVVALLLAAYCLLAATSELSARPARDRPIPPALSRPRESGTLAGVIPRPPLRHAVALTTG